ncbi:AAA family ATPase [Nonomuraea sp. NPDC047529]|uniref:AAA family ATPase n=1 Tax=Nonomuraea sp. NPDC047529 TaxID=3155623 RepID=UPI0033F978A6
MNVRVVDEGAIVDDRQLAALLSEARRTVTKVVLIGDPVQLRCLVRAPQQRATRVQSQDTRGLQAPHEREACLPVRTFPQAPDYREEFVVEDRRRAAASAEIAGRRCEPFGGAAVRTGESARTRDKELTRSWPNRRQPRPPTAT